MPRIVGRPDLPPVQCTGIRASTSFRLGRKRLQEDSEISTRLLLKHPVTLCESYKTGDAKYEINAVLTLIERDDDRADMWRLAITAFPAIPSPEVSPRIDGDIRPTRLLSRLGKMGLETDFSVMAWFYSRTDPANLPPLPIEREYVKGAFSHMVGYNLARFGDLGQVLYEMRLSKTTQNYYDIEVSFSYRRILDENVLVASLSNAAQFLSVIKQAPPAEGETPEEQQPEGETPDEQHLVTEGQEDAENP